MKTLGKTPQPQHGIGLIEVLVTILLLAVGLLGMSKIHGLLIRDGGTANNRALAISLAQQKLDDLRSFKWIDPARSSGQNCDSGVFCYSEIAGNLGGLEKSDGTLELPPGNVTVGPTTFNRTWTVTTNTAPDFKVVTVTVTWTDPNGAASEALTSAIAAEDPTVTAFGAAGPGGGGDGPKASYTPQPPPDVVPIAISGTSTRETSKPEPDVSRNGSSVATQFSSVNYDAANKQQVQEDFKTVRCKCKFVAADALANPPAYYRYDAATGLEVVYPGQSDAYRQISKKRGEPATTPGEVQDPLCDSCCADHHDKKTDTSVALFNPDPLFTDYAVGGDDHKHYATDGTSEVLPDAATAYVEACRFLRVDGIYRIMQDWRLAAFKVLPQTGYFETNLTQYQTYVSEKVLYTASRDPATPPANSPSSNPTLGSLELTNPINNQMLARAIYVDRVYASPRVLDADFYTQVFAATNPIGIKGIPFSEVNVTVLAGWKIKEGDATVTNGELQSISANNSNYYGIGTRGLVSRNGAGEAYVQSKLLGANSGLVGGANLLGARDAQVGIRPVDGTTEIRDEIKIKWEGTPGIVSGQLYAGNDSADLTAINVSGGSGCTVAARVGDLASFSCSVSGDGNITFTTKSGRTAFLDKSTCAFAGGAWTDCEVTVYGPTIKIHGTCSGNRCNNSADPLTINVITTGSPTPCVRDRTTPYCVVTLTGDSLASLTWSGSIQISGPRNIGIVSGSGPATCTVQTSASAPLSRNFTTGVWPVDQFGAFSICANN